MTFGDQAFRCRLTLALSTALAVASGRRQRWAWNRQPGVTGTSRACPRCSDASPHAGGRYIEVFREKTVPTAKGPPKNSTQPWQGRTLGENEEEEDLADSGRLFVRNLPYTSSEEDLEKIFSRYGRDTVPRRGAHAQSSGRESRRPGSRPGDRPLLSPFSHL